jgi:hypothetical protein
MIVCEEDHAKDEMEMDVPHKTGQIIQIITMNPLIMLSCAHHYHILSVRVSPLYSGMNVNRTYRNYKGTSKNGYNGPVERDHTHSETVD